MYWIQYTLSGAGPLKNAATNWPPTGRTWDLSFLSSHTSTTWPYILSFFSLYRPVQAEADLCSPPSSLSTWSGPSPNELFRAQTGLTSSHTAVMGITWNTECTLCVPGVYNMCMVWSSVFHVLYVGCVCVSKDVFICLCCTLYMSKGTYKHTHVTYTP